MFKRFYKDLTSGEVKVLVRIVITFIILGVGLYVILSPRYDDSTRKWAFGMVGAVIGYWLKD
ncbi:MAG TPA: hypothetical protein EYP24_03335 [bacterium (Candidatus Stahlbacteria)]|nr:hypothetical protein [Candidatus Stahlbacteria bacterium]